MTMQPKLSLELGTIIWVCPTQFARGSGAGGDGGCGDLAKCGLLAGQRKGTNWKVNKDLKTSPDVTSLSFLLSSPSTQPFPYLVHFSLVSATMVYSVPRKAAGLMLAAAGARVLAADCGLDSWECAPSYSAVPACATAAIESAALEAGCAHGDYKCECGKKEELQGLIFDEVVANCGLLGGLDVVKAVSYLCDCDATASTFTACPTVAPTSTTASEPPIITEPPATPTDCGLDSWECAPLYSSVPACATAAIESAALEAGCAHGDYKCECSKKEELQGLIFDEVVANCGLLGGLDVVKAVSYLCDCDATATTFEPCASATVVPPSSTTANSEPPIITSAPVLPSSTVSEPPVITEPPTDCGLDSWECAPLYSAVPVCATAIIESAALEVGCAHGDYNCECSKSEELQGLIFDEVVAGCGLLGGLDVLKAVSSLCACDATATTFEPCPTGGAPSSVISIPSSVPAEPSSEPQPSAEPSTTDDCDDDDEPTSSSAVVQPSDKPSDEPSSQPAVSVTTTSSPVEPSGNPTEPCGEESWACAPEYAAVPVCAVDIIAKAGLSLGCAAGDHKCECSKSAEIQELIFDEVIAACGLLGGLDVIKAVTALCECDAAKPTFKPCDGNSGPGPTSSAPAPGGGGGDSTITITTTDIVTSDCSTSTSGPVVIPSSTVVPSSTESVPGPEPSSGPCGEESWGCATEFAAVPQCAVPIIEKAALDLGCAKGDHKCECANAEDIQGKIALDVLGACGAAKVVDVLSSVEALCKCDAAKPTFTPCGGSSGPGPGPTSSAAPVPSGEPSGEPSGIPSSVVVPPPSSIITSSPGTEPSGTIPSGPCGIDSWECAPLFSAVPGCAVPIIQKAALDLGCKEGDHHCECSNAEKIQGAIALDVLGACGAAKVADVLSSVEALCKCDSAKPTFTECGSGPGPTGPTGPGNGGGGGGSGPGPTGSSSSAGPITTTSAPAPGGGSGGGSGSSDCPAATSTPEGPCGIDSWACAEQFKAVPSCAVSIIEEAAISVGCSKGDHKCECTNQEKIQGIVFNDVLSACGVATGAKVISAVQALCECDSAKPTFTECGGAAPAPTGDCNGGGNGGGSGPSPGPSSSAPAGGAPGGGSGSGPSTSAPGGGGSGPSSSSFVTVTHSTTITTSAGSGPTGGDSSPTGGDSGSGPSGTGGSDSGPTGGNGDGGSGSGPSGTGGSDVPPVPEPSDAIPPPPVVGGASKMIASTGCVGLMAIVFAALL